jgi:hypothetical protein
MNITYIYTIRMNEKFWAKPRIHPAMSSALQWGSSMHFKRIIIKRMGRIM